MVWGLHACTSCLSLLQSPPYLIHTSPARPKNIWMGTRVPIHGQLQPRLTPGEQVRKCARVPKCTTRWGLVSSSAGSCQHPSFHLLLSPVPDSALLIPQPIETPDHSPPPKPFPHPHVPEAGWLLNPKRSGSICMVVRVSGKWSDLSLPVAGPAHSTSVSDSSCAVLFAVSARKCRGCSQAQFTGHRRGSPGQQQYAPPEWPGRESAAESLGPELGVAPQEPSPGQQLPPPTFLPVAAPPGQHVKSRGCCSCRRHLGKSSRSSSGGPGRAGAINPITGRPEGQGTLSALTAPAGPAPCAEPCPSPRPRAAHGAAPERHPILPPCPQPVSAAAAGAPATGEEEDRTALRHALHLALHVPVLVRRLVRRRAGAAASGLRLPRRPRLASPGHGSRRGFPQAAIPGGASPPVGCGQGEGRWRREPRGAESRGAGLPQSHLQLL